MLRLIVLMAGVLGWWNVCRRLSGAGAGVCAAWGVAVVAVIFGATSGGAGGAAAQGLEFAGRPIRQITIDGLELIEPRLVENVLRARVGEPYDPTVVEQDIVRITNLGYFGGATAHVQQTDDGGVLLEYRVEELPVLRGVDVRGNDAIEREDLLDIIQVRPGDAVDDFVIDRARQAIVKAYEEAGYFVTDVSLDEEALREERRLVFLIREGPRIRIRSVDFEGNEVLSDGELKKQVEAKAWFPVFGTKRVVNREELELDAARLREYYQDRGYLEAQVGRRIVVADNQRDANIIFTITEGPRWTVGDIRFEGLDGQELIFAPEQLRLVMDLKAGDVYSARKLRQSTSSILNLYGRLGYLDTRLIRRNRSDNSSGIDRLYNPDTNTVDLLVTIDQGTPTTVGKVTVRGNGVTRSKVVLRELRGIEPGRRFDRQGLEESRRRLNEGALFQNATITLLGEDDDPQRDVIVEVAERNTGSISFGATVSSDDGVLGAIDVTQRNFDITDTPESWDDLLSNRAFRGGGQTFNLSLSPGSRNSRYAIGLSDPYFLDSDYNTDAQLSYFNSDRTDYDEARGALRLGIGKRFGDVWSAGVRGRGENVQISSIEDDAALDVFAVEGSSVVTGLSFRVTRDTTDSFLQPSAGSRVTASVERVGALGGDYDFTKLNLSYDKFWTLSRDFLDRKSILTLSLDAGYIPEENRSPTFERFYAGGHTTFRGFENRGVGPRGIRADTLTPGDEAVGGDWMFLTGLQYEVPLVDNYLRGVVFTDQGVLGDEPTLDDWRISIGAGIRLQIPFLSQAPFAIDLAIPLTKEEGDQEQVLSFAIDIPFQ